MSAVPADPPPALPRPASDPPSGVQLREVAEDSDLRASLGGLLNGPLPQPASWARALRVSKHDAEDIVQDAILALIEKRDAPPRSPHAWLFGAARVGRRRLARARARAAAYEPQIEAFLRGLDGPFPSPEDEVERRERLLAVLWLLDQVKPGRRAVAERHLFGGAMEQDIAAELGLSLPTVKSQWRRAKEDMRGALDREMAKRGGDKAWLAGLAALVAALWLWITRRVRSRSGPLLACASLALVVPAHAGLRASGGSPAEDAASCAPLPLPSLAFVVPAWAERERDAASGSLTTPEATVKNPRIGGVVGTPTAATAASRDSRLLAKAREALRRGDLGEAALALRTYEANHPDPSVDSLHRALRIELAERVNAQR